MDYCSTYTERMHDTAREAVALGMRYRAARLEAGPFGMQDFKSRCVDEEADCAFLAHHYERLARESESDGAKMAIVHSAQTQARAARMPQDALSL